jgi:glycosyltransferase involved in cell wall biosynthesis
MNIGIVTTWFERGAAYVSRLYRDVLEKDHQIFIYVRAGDFYAQGDPNWSGSNVTWGKKSRLPISTPIELNDFQRWIEKNRLEIIFFNEQNWWNPVIFCNSMGIKTGGYVDYYTEQTIPLFGCYDFIICNTKRHYSVFDWHPQCFYVPWGTDISLFTPKSFRPVEEGVVTFFHSAGMNPERKGTDLVIRAFSCLQSSKARLVIHSQLNLKTIFPHLENLISNLEYQGSIQYYEQTVPAPGLYHFGDVYIYPSRLEGIGLTVPEALACGLPVITSESPPMSEFINETNGKLVKVSRLFSRADGYYWPQCLVDESSLVEQMEFYIENYRELEAYKRAARADADRNLDWFKNAKDLPRIFENITKRPNNELLYSEQLARQFELDRMSIGLSIALRFPKLYWLASLFLPILKRVMGKKRHDLF